VTEELGSVPNPAALAACGRNLVVFDLAEIKHDLVADMIDVLVSFTPGWTPVGKEPGGEAVASIKADDRCFSSTRSPSDLNIVRGLNFARAARVAKVIPRGNSAQAERAQ
jgi:hypothetical protein